MAVGSRRGELWRLRRSARSSLARSPTIGLTLSHPVADLAVQLGSPDYFALTVVALLPCRPCSARRCRAVSPRCRSVCCSAGRHGHAHRPAAVHLRRSGAGRRHRRRHVRRRPLRGRRGALGRVPAAARPAEVIPVRGRSWMTRTDWRRSWKPWLRGTALGFPIGTIPAGGAESRPSSPTRRRRSCPSTRTSSATARSRVSPGRRRRTTRPRPACSSRCSRSACRPRRPPRSCRRLPELRDPARPAAVPERVDAGLGADRSSMSATSLLLVLNLPLVGIWVKLLQIPRPYLYAGILCSRRSAATR